MNGMALQRVLFLCSVYHPHVGGVETAVRELAGCLRRSGIAAAILTKRFPLALPGTATVLGVPVYRFARPRKPTEYERVRAWLRRHQATLRADLVHVVGVRRPMPVFGLWLAKLWRVPCLMTFAGGDLPDANDRDSVRIWRESLATVPPAVQQADGWSAFSRATAARAEEVLGVGPIHVIRGGLNPAAIARAPRHRSPHPYFFTARRLTHAKGIDVLIAAFRRVAAAIPRHRLLIAGDGPERAALARQVKRQRLDERVRFVGELRQREVFSYLKGAVAHICPSRAESGGLINFEAQAAGCLAIGSTAGGIAEYIAAQRTGLLFKLGDADDLAAKLLLAAEESPQLRAIKRRARDAVARYDWSTFTQRYQRLYEQQLAGYAGERSAPRTEPGWPMDH